MFRKIGHDKLKMQIPWACPALPVFLLPGILRDGSNFSLIAQKLYTKSTYSRPIYVYYDENLVDVPADQELDITISLDELVEDIANAIQGILTDPVGSFPCFIVGYSYGCTLATLVAQTLKKRGEFPYVYLIDGTAPQLASENLKSPDLTSMNDLINMINYAASYASLPQIIPFVDEKNMHRFQHLSLEDRIDKLMREIIKKNFPKMLVNPPYTYLNFIRAMDVIKNSLNHLSNYMPKQNEDNILLDSITILTTNETTKKYGDQQSAWQHFANNVKLIATEDLVKQNHFALVQNEKTANKLARSINRFFNHCVSKEQFEKFYNQYQAILAQKRADCYSDDEASDDDSNMLKKSRPIHITSGCPSPELSQSPGGYRSSSTSPTETDPEDEDNIVNCGGKKKNSLLGSASRLFSFQEKPPTNVVYQLKNTS